MIRIFEDDFAEWRSHPMTQHLLTALDKECARIKETWCQVSLDGGRNDPLELARYRERISAYRDIIAIDRDRLEELVNEQS